MSSLRRYEGALIIDHRASPGLPAGVARNAGYDPKHCGEGGFLEVAIIKCCHCGTAFVADVRIYCKGCNRYICEGCYAETFHPGYKHTPVEKKLDSMLSDKPSPLYSSATIVRGA